MHNLTYCDYIIFSAHQHSPTVLAARYWRVVDSFRDCAIASQLPKTSGAATSFFGVRLGYLLSSLTTPSRLLRNMGRFPRFRHRSISQESPPSNSSPQARPRGQEGGQSARTCDGGACDALRMETRFHCDGIPSERVGLIPRSGIRARAVPETSCPALGRQHCWTEDGCLIGCDF